MCLESVFRWRFHWQHKAHWIVAGLGAVAGAGCFEVHLTSYMRERARSERASPDCEKQRRRILAGLEVVADCILEIPASIDPLDAVASSQVIDALREANSASISCQSLNLALLDEEKNRVGADTECMFGWDVGKRRCVPVWGTGSENSAVLDSAEAKICSLQAAIAAAETMMQIDHVVP
jgi:chaperonin GroEL (HSP60 family)